MNIELLNGMFEDVDLNSKLRHLPENYEHANIEEGKFHTDRVWHVLERCTTSAQKQ